MHSISALSRLLGAAVFSAVLIAAGTARAATPSVEGVKVRAGQGGTYSFAVSVRHPDRGWDHYADLWEVLDPAGNVLATRVLLHPHVDEQPFTRSLSGVVVPAGIAVVTVRARCNIDGYGAASPPVALPPRP